MFINNVILQYLSKKNRTATGYNEAYTAEKKKIKKNSDSYC